jgi:hypothetical protein
MTSDELNKWVTVVDEVPAALAAQACFAMRARAGVEVVEVPVKRKPIGKKMFIPPVPPS